MTSPVRADVCIIGAGLVGCASAYQLAKRGADVIVLERGWPGAGSSSGGMGGRSALVQSANRERGSG